MKVTRQQLWDYLSNGGQDYDTFDQFREEVIPVDEVPSIDRVIFDALKGCDLKHLVADASMSEHHLGGDNLVSMAEDVLAALEEGYVIATWYGPKTEALVVGYQPDELTIVD